MTCWDLLAIAARRWYVVLVGLLLTVGGLYAIEHAPGVYATQTNVLFLAPTTPRSPNTISSPTSGVIAMAGLVERILNDGVEKPATSGTVSLTGQGIDDGYSIVLPDAGGQWSTNFNSPVLQVQVAGPSAEQVRTELDQLLARISDTARRLQVEDGVAPELLIRTRVSPTDPVVGYRQGHRRMGLAAAVLLGSLLTGLAAVGIEIASRRRRGRAGAPTSSPILGNSHL